MGGGAAGGGGRCRWWWWAGVVAVGVVVVMPSYAAANIDLYMSSEETHRLLGLLAELYYVREGVINTYALNFTVPVPANFTYIYFTWSSLIKRPMQYMAHIDYNNGEAMALPQLNISNKGVVPAQPDTFSVSLPCSGRVNAEVMVNLHLNITMQNLTNITMQNLTIKRLKICLKEDFAPRNESIYLRPKWMSTSLGTLYVGAACTFTVLVITVASVLYLRVKRTRTQTRFWPDRSGRGTGAMGNADDGTGLSVAATPVPLKHYIRACSVLAPNNSQIYIPEMKLVSCNSSGMIKKYEFGERKFGIQEKVIMLVGATGSGKTTLMNGFVNYVFGVEWKDSYRFKMIMEPNAANQAMSQTTKITSYTLHHQEGFRVPFSLTIVDTPGFGDVTGIMRDKEITENIHNFFTTRGENGISHIDGVGFVVNSSLPRLTPTQRYIFGQILSLFGEDVADNIFLLLTFADGKKSQVLSGIKEAKIPYKKHFKFNNSALYAFQNEGCGSTDSNSDEEDGSFDSMFWEMGVKSFIQFLEQLRLAESKSLILTQDVLNERNRLRPML